MLSPWAIRHLQRDLRDDARSGGLEFFERLDGDIRRIGLEVIELQARLGGGIGFVRRVRIGTQDDRTDDRIELRPQRVAGDRGDGRQQVEHPFGVLRSDGQRAIPGVGGDHQQVHRQLPRLRVLSVGGKRFEAIDVLGQGRRRLTGQPLADTDDRVARVARVALGEHLQRQWQRIGVLDLRQPVQRLTEDLGRHVLAAEDRFEGFDRGGELGQHLRRAVLDRIGDRGGRQRLVAGDHRLQQLRDRQLGDRVLQDRVEFGIGRLASDDEDRFGRFRGGVFDRRLNRFGADQSRLIGGRGQQHRSPLRDRSGPMLERPNRGGANPWLGGLHQCGEQLGLRDPLFLEHPGAFQQGLGVRRFPHVATGGPGEHFADDVVGRATAQFDPCAIPRGVFLGVERVANFGDRLARESYRFDQRPTRIGHAINTAVLIVAIGVTHVVLHVTD